MKSIKRNIPIKIIIVIVFTAVMSLSICSMGYLVFSRWISSAKQTTEQIATRINENIHIQIDSYLSLPEQINESNYKILANGILDLSDETRRDKFFVGVLTSYEDPIYSFSFGAATGDYYGARRNEKGVVEIMRNNAGTGGNSWYYSVGEDMTADELVLQAGKFDPRTRAWYQTAAEARAPSFSPVYKHFVMNDLTISYAHPLYDQNGMLEGVLGTHMLLRDIGSSLADAVRQYNGYAVILEKSSGKLIANSMGIDNFTTLADGTLQRYAVGALQNPDIQEAYAQYQTSPVSNFQIDGKSGNYYINTKEIYQPGLEWIVITAVPESFLISPALQSIQLTAFLALLSLLLSIAIYAAITGKLLKPMNSLLEIADVISSGDLTKRIPIVRNDEIGKLSESFNNVTDKMQTLVNHLEDIVIERTDELQKTNATLEENKDQLRLILDSAAEAIYGIDIRGNCTFCNISCIRLLGYKEQSELLGKNMHRQIHYADRDGTLKSDKECNIYRSFLQGMGTHADDEVFWRADGTSFDVEYDSYPQVKDGKIVGAVVTFMDISDRKRKEAEIQYLSFFDPLTGLQNRRSFEENRAKIDRPNSLPLSVVFADINGLKMINDIFGHAAGDELIKKSSEILSGACRKGDIIARIGGDEFVILLPRTDRETAETILTLIKDGLTGARVEAIKCTISLGLDTKNSPDQSLDEVMANAENAMYKDKTLNRRSINKNFIDTIIETLHSRNPREKLHSVAVRRLCSEMGTFLHLPEPELGKLKRAAYLHDIGKIIMDQNALTKDQLSEEEQEKMKQHSAVGYRILNLFDDTLDLAEYVYSHHEKWDGTGFPRGLKGEQIPLLSRIIMVAETYDHIVGRGADPLQKKKEAALEMIENGAGTLFDPQVAAAFIQIESEKSGEDESAYKA